VKPSRNVHLTRIKQNGVCFVLVPLEDEHPALVEPAPVRLMAHHIESLELEAIPVQYKKQIILKLSMELNQQTIQLLESAAWPHSSTAGALLRRLNGKQKLPSKHS
jgi:hypothetical protein